MIKHWAEQFEDYVEKGERAPMTGLKSELIESSRSEAQREVADLARATLDTKKAIALAMKDIEGWVRNSVDGRVFDSDSELRKTMIDIGMMQAAHRIKHGGRLQYVMITPELYGKVAGLVHDEASYNKAIREAITAPTDIIGESM
jgi:hypothetical protein